MSKTHKKKRRSVFNPKRWVDVDSAVDTGGWLLTNIKQIFTPRTAQHHETFEEAVARLGLDEVQIKQREQSFYRHFWATLFLGVALVLYGIFWLFQGAMVAGFISFMLSGIALAKALERRFWYFQVKSRQLGLSLRHWFCADILRRPYG